MSAPVARAGADLRLLRAAVFAAVCVALSAAGHMLASCEGAPLWTLGCGFVAVFAVSAPLAGRECRLPGIAAGLAVGQLALHALFELGQHAATGPASRGRPSDGTLIALAARLVCAGDGGPVRLSAAEARRIVGASGIAPRGHLAHAGGAHAADAHAAGAHAAGSGGLDTGAVPAFPSLADALLPSLPMLLGHLLAALVLGLLLRRGEAALFRLVRLSARGVAEGALVRSLRAALALVRALRGGLPGAPPAPLLRGRCGHGRGMPLPSSLVLEHSVSRRGPPRFDLAA
ncbi:hypothetical protein ABZW18_27190 [Streptomyces sp. NPDC004647]|uniref:hypothetical protein n=1 Tax=Streptomyces sp. NPDC004647 TaxID=3154671 RepID=UPI0033BF336A